MNFLNYSLVALISFLGLVVGIIIISLAKEEQRPGRKYFIIAKDIVLLLIIGILGYYLKLVSLIFVFLILVIFLLKKYKFKKLKQDYLVYSILGLALFISKDIKELFLVVASSIFIYGLVYGAIVRRKSLKNNIILVLKNVGYLVVSIGLATIFHYLF